MKIIKSLSLALLLICLVSSMALAANTTIRSGNFIEIILDGSTDWDITTTVAANGVALKSIAFYPSAANDVLVVRDGSATGTRIFSGKDVGGGGIIVYYDGIMAKPYIKASSCTLGTPANARVIITTSR